MLMIVLSMLMMSSPILAQTDKMNLENVKKTEKGWLLTDKQMISLANHIKELRGYKELAKERGELIKEYEKQMDNYKEQLKKEKKADNIQRIDDGLTGAGIASLIVLIAGTSN